MSEPIQDKMNKKGDTAKIVMIYSVVAVISVLIISLSMWLSKKHSQSAEADVRAGERSITYEYIGPDVGSMDILKLTEDFVATNQDGVEVNLQSLEGKVWVFAQFYGSCPECNKVNFTLLADLYETYKNDNNFKMVVMSVKQEVDGVAAMKSMANTLQADTSNWWFLAADDVNEVNEYCSKNMLYLEFQENTNKEQSGMQGEIAHDMGISLFNHEMIMKKKIEVYSKRDNKKFVAQKKKELNAEIVHALKQL